MGYMDMALPMLPLLLDFKFQSPVWSCSGWVTWGQCSCFSLIDRHILLDCFCYIPSSQYWEWGLSSDLGYCGNVHVYIVVTSEQLMLTHIVCMCMLAAFFLMALCCVHSYIAATAVCNVCICIMYAWCFLILLEHCVRSYVAETAILNVCICI